MRVLFGDRDADILSLSNSGVSGADIGKKYSISRERVRQIIARLGGELTAKKKLERNIEQIKEMANAYLTAKEMAEKLGTSYHSVRQTLYDHDIKVSHARFSSWDMLGDKFGKWTIIDDKRPESLSRKVLCECECGKQQSVDIHHLRYGRSKGCGSCAAKLIWQLKKEGKQKC